MPATARRRAGARVGALVGLLALAGCATLPPPRPADTGWVRAEEARGLLERWEAEWRTFPGLRAAVDLTVRRRDRVDRTGAVLLLSRTRLRLEVVTPFGLPALVATASPERVVVFRPLERAAWTGRPSPDAVGRWLGAPLPPDVLIGLFVGRVPPPPDPARVRIQGGHDPHLAFERDGIAHRVWVTPEGRPARLLIEGDERVSVTFEWAPGGPLEGVRVEVPGRGAALVLRYLSVELSTPPEDSFELALPVDVRLHVD